MEPSAQDRLAPTLEVLVATIDQTDLTLHETMQITSDAIIANQGESTCVAKADLPEGRTVTYINTKTRGVGINRNIALEAASADICVFADDDIVYYPGYERAIVRTFEENPDADLIFFNLDSDEDLFKISGYKRVRWWNFLRYGTARAAVRLSSVREFGITFDERFGGGAKYRHGEDTLFFAQCMKHGMKLYSAPVTVGELTNVRESTWSKGYDRKYVIDQGQLYRAMSRRFSWLWIAQDAVRRSRRDYGMSPFKAFILMVRETQR